MKALEALLRDRGVVFSCLDNRIRCFPHIINICSTHVIKSFTDIDLVDDQAEFDMPNLPDNNAAQTYKEAAKRDPIALCRSTVRAVRTSGKRRDHLQKIITNGNENGWITSHENIKVPKVQLLHDVKTWWDSVHKMIRRFRELRPVSNSQTFTYEHLRHSQIGYPRFRLC
jgi:hypothetical protein